MTINTLQEKKKRGEKIVMLTAYDYPLALLIDQCGADIILVGDSVANVILGLESTREVGMDEMIHHASAVHRAVNDALLVGDMPYESYQVSSGAAVANAQRFIDEAGCGAVKLEWSDQCPDVAARIVEAGIPVMGHVGLTPQTADKLGGFKVQGRDHAAAVRIIDQARALESSGCFCLVLECIPDRLAKHITQSLAIPTIGIGAGPSCDGQVLVTHDLLGLYDRKFPKFVKQYININAFIKKALHEFLTEVIQGKFPDDEHSYHMKESEWAQTLEARSNKTKQ